MDYFQELRVNELLANHATSARREKTAGQVTVLFILLCMDNNRKKLPFSINGIGTIVPVCSKKNITDIIKCYSDFQEIWPIAQEAILH